MQHPLLQKILNGLLLLGGGVLLIGGGSCAATFIFAFPDPVMIILVLLWSLPVLLAGWGLLRWRGRRLHGQGDAQDGS